MKILHICNDFSASKVHASLYQELDALDIEQTIFSPVRDASLIGNNIFKSLHTDFVYANVVKPYHRYVYHLKRKHVFNEMLKRIDVRQFNLCHATTLLTDGGLAYLLYKKYGIPYVVAVRNTDINGFLDLMPHTWLSARKILLHAARVFFISDGLKRKFLSHVSVRGIVPKIEKKIVLMPNGINDYFLDHVQHRSHTGHGVIYVGDFSSNKNVVRLGEAVLRLKKEPQFQDIMLTIVGGGHDNSNRVQKMISNHPDTMNYIGKIYDKEKLCSLYSKNKVFAMPSIHETFGLVYLEALSQNLPVLYTKGQGIDGLFSESVGIAVNPLSVDEIATALRQLLTNDKYSNKEVDFSRFRWRLIAQQYLNNYRSVK